MYENDYILYKLKTTDKSYQYIKDEFNEKAKDGLWDYYNRIIKNNGAIVLFGTEPFSSKLRMSNLKMYKYDWIYHKNKSTGFLNAKKQPLNNYELISVFYKKQCIYNPQKTKAEKIYKRGYVNRKKSDCYGKERNFIQIDDGLRYPTRIIYFNNNHTHKQLHPTQKPVALCEYLIRTYTNEGDIVLDNCAGSGTTGVACINTGRNYILMEKEPKYCKIAEQRIAEAKENHQSEQIHLAGA